MLHSSHPILREKVTSFSLTTLKIKNFRESLRVSDIKKSPELELGHYHIRRALRNAACPISNTSTTFHIFNSLLMTSLNLTTLKI